LSLLSMLHGTGMRSEQETKDDDGDDDESAVQPLRLGFGLIGWALMPWPWRP
jgi:hypothetical protein